MKSLKFAALAACTALALASCNKNDDITTNAIKFTPSSVTVAVGESQNVIIAGGSGTYTAKSGDEKISTVSVSKNILTIKGVEAGKAVITVTDDKKVSASLNVVVAEGIKLDKAESSVAVGKEDAVKISGGTSPYSAVSKDSKIATATIKDATLTIKGIAEGSTTITITDKNKMTATVKVTVSK